MYLCLSIILISTSVVLSEFVNGYKSYKNYKLYEVSGQKDGVIKLLEELTDIDNSLVYDGNSDAHSILVAPNLDTYFLESVLRNNLNSKLLHKDYSEIILAEKFKTRRSGNFGWTAYYDVDNIYNYLRNISATHAGMAQLIVGGQSYEGRQLLGVRINTPKVKDKPVFFIESGIHAREWIAPATTTYFINELLTSRNPQIQAMRDLFDWRIFPTVNPDGYHYSFNIERYWRKTRSRSSNGCYGADGNRNWDYNWGQHSSSRNPCDPQLYIGSKPFSEIETRTLSSYISRIENLLAYVGFHSYGPMLLIPYSDSTKPVDNYNDLVQIGRASLQYGSRIINEERYRGPATAAQLIYKASGGSMDWVRHALGTNLVYTYELRGEFFSWPAERIVEQGDEVTQMMLGLVTEAKNLGYC